MDYSVNYATIDFTQTNLHVLNQVVEEHKRNEHPGVRVDLEIKGRTDFDQKCRRVISALSFGTNISQIHVHPRKIHEESAGIL